MRKVTKKQKEAAVVRLEESLGKSLQDTTDVLGLRVMPKHVFMPKRHNRIARQAALEGVTSIAALARLCGIDKQVCVRWLKRHVTFRRAWEQTIDLRSIEVEAALVKRALGYEQKSVERRVEKNAATGEKKVIKVVKTEHIPGDVSAQKLFLQNRRSKRWNKEKGIPQKSVHLDIKMDATDRDL